MLLTVVLATAAMAVPAGATPAKPDPEFGPAGSGRVTTDLGGLDSVSDVAIQGDGKIVAVGAGAGDEDSSEFAVVRYDERGELDSSFGDAGKVATDFGQLDSAAAVVIQGDGKIVVAGSSCDRTLSAACDSVMARYSPNGSLDPTFGAGGRVITDFGYQEAFADLAFAADGNLIVAGSSTELGRIGSTFALARYNTNGVLDATFGPPGKFGKVTTFVGSFTFGSALTIQGDGKLVVAGRSDGDVALARYTANGVLDKTFGVGDGDGIDGAVVTDVGAEGGAYDIVRQGNGLLVAGHGGPSPGPGFGGEDVVLARFGDNGSLDAVFGDGGITITDLGIPARASALVLQPDGKIAVVGRAGGATNGDYLLLAYSSDGDLDGGFGTGGRVLTDFGGDDTAHALALSGAGNDKLIVVGKGGPGADFALVRYVDPTACPQSSDELGAGSLGDISSTTGPGSSGNGSGVGPALVDVAFVLSASATAATRRRPRRRLCRPSAGRRLLFRRRPGVDNGFTLVELLAVIVILGILSGVVVFAVRGMGNKGRDEAIAIDERIIRTAMETYCAKHGRYPSGDDPMGVLVAERFLGTPSEHHGLATGDDRDLFPEGNCMGAGPKYYKLAEPAKGSDC